MRKTDEQLEAGKLERFLNSLSLDSDFVGLLGVGYRNSFYKVFVRRSPTTKNWWLFEWHAGRSSVNPLKMSLGKSVELVHAQLPRLVDFEYMTEKTAIGKLRERAAELRANSAPEKEKAGARKSSKKR